MAVEQYATMSTKVVVPKRERLQQIEKQLAVKQESMRLIRGGAVAVQFVFCGEEVAGGRVDGARGQTVEGGAAR